VSVAVSKLGCTELFFVEPGVKVDGAYYRDVLLSQHMRLGDNGVPIGNGPLEIEWSRERLRHVTLKGQVMTPICLVPIISKMAGDSDLVTMECL